MGGGILRRDSQKRRPEAFKLRVFSRLPVRQFLFRSPFWLATIQE